MSDTKAGYVQGKERSKSGKSWKLKLDGKWISVSNRANMDGVEQGVYVEYQTGGFNGEDGKFIPTVERIRPAQAPAGSTPPATNGAASRLLSAAWDDSALRFISNVVGCAIESGKCESPIQLGEWAFAAQDALITLTGERIQGQAQTPETPDSTPSGSGDIEGWDDLAPAPKGPHSPPW
jgi:hypothetical protein